MRVSRLFTQLWLLCGSLVAGGYDARTLEVEFFYRAYRLDVEVSVAEFLADPNNAGKDPNVEKPWKMARNIKSYNQPEDWPDRRIPSRLYGLNFIAWLYGVEADHWHGREAARQRITDPVDPDFFAAFADEKDEKGNYIEPRRSLSRLPRDDGIPLAPLKENSAELADKKQSSYKFSYNSLAMHRVLGDLDMGSGLEGDNRKYYYDMVNVMAIVINYCKDLYAKYPEIARPHYEKMAEALKEARYARMLDSRKWLEGEKPLKFKDEVSESQTWFRGWKAPVFDLQATRAKWPSNIRAHKEALVGSGANDGILGQFVRDWANGSIAELRKTSNRGNLVWHVPGKSKNKENQKHLQVFRAEYLMEKSIRAQIASADASPSAPGCEWVRDRAPGEKPGAPLRKRAALEELREIMERRSRDW